MRCHLPPFNSARGVYKKVMTPTGFLSCLVLGVEGIHVIFFATFC
jgi:hypothetical protein